jgi:hypothetical protein
MGFLCRKEKSLEPCWSFVEEDVSVVCDGSPIAAWFIS